MFGKRRPDALPEPSADGMRDDALPMLSVEQGAALGQLAEQVGRRLGLADATYDGHGVLTTAGTSFGLHNLAAGLVDVPWSRWPDAVERHLGAVSAAQAERARPVRDDQKLLKLRLAADLPVQPQFDAPSGLPGILALPALDYPTHVDELTTLERVDALGGLDELLRLGLANLRALPKPGHIQVQAKDEVADSVLHIFTTDDYFGASRVLVLDQLLGEALKVERPEYGCLIAVPNRHLLLVHLVAGPGVVPALQSMINIAVAESFDKPGPLAESVFYRPASGASQQVTTRTPDGITVTVDGALEQAFTALGLTS